MLCFVPITYFVVMVMIGGIDKKGPGDYNILFTVEVFDPTNPSLSCKLPETKKIAYHGSLGLTVCGGIWHEKSCQTFDLNWKWKHSHKLNHKRNRCLMWRNPMGQIMLIGSEYLASMFTTETLLDDGTTKESFLLSQEHSARYGKDNSKKC